MKTTRRHSLLLPWLLLLVVRGNDASYLFQTSTPYVLTSGGEEGLNATSLAWKLLTEDELHPLDCVEHSLSQTCELNHCRDDVGPYGIIDENGDISLDAMIMDGTSKEVGAVGNLKHVRAAISVARAVMKYTTHTFITGNDATSFAEEMGFPVEDLRTEDTESSWEDWKENSCQPNHRQNVDPDPEENCGPYTPTVTKNNVGKSELDGIHDTIGQFIIDSNQESVVGLTTNGLMHKVPGRVGDSPVPGSGGYAWSGVGAASAAGNGDIMLRLLPSVDIVTRMEAGVRPDVALIAAANRMIEAFPDTSFYLYAGNAEGQFSAVCHNNEDALFSAQSHDMEASVIRVNCEESMIPPEDAPRT